MVLHQRHRTLDRAAMAGNHDLRGVIVVGDGADFALRSRISQCLCLFDVRAQQRSHRTFAHRHGGLHRLTAQLEQARGGGDVERLDRTESAIFAQRMARDIVALVADRKAAFLLHHAQRGDGVGHDRGLSILRQGQVAVRPFHHDAEQMLRQGVIDLLKQRLRRRAGVRQSLAHAHRLAALPRKKKCPHDYLQRSAPAEKR